MTFNGLLFLIFVTLFIINPTECYRLVWYPSGSVPKPKIDVDAEFHSPLHERTPKQIIGTSVVTSVSVVKDQDPEEMKSHYENIYRRNNLEKPSYAAMEPKFQFYLYNDRGELVREKLSIHDIQRILLQQTQIRELANRGWLIEKHDKTDSGNEIKPNDEDLSSTPLSVRPVKNATKDDVRGVLNKIHDIIKDAKQKNSNEVFLSNQINVEFSKNQLTTPMTTASTASTNSNNFYHFRDQNKKKKHDYQKYKERYHGLLSGEATWVDSRKKEKISELESGFKASLGHIYTPTHPQVYHNKNFEDFLEKEYEDDSERLYDEENGSSEILMTSLNDGKESSLEDSTFVEKSHEHDELIRQGPQHSEHHNHHDNESSHDHDLHHDAHHEPSTHSEEHHSSNHHPPNHHPHHHHHHHETHMKNAFPDVPKDNLGLTATTANLNRNMKHFVDVNNKLGISVYKNLVLLPKYKKRNTCFSPLSMETTLSLVFLGARGNTSWQINELLHLDEMISFNPHLIYKEFMDSISQSQGSGFVKQLLIDKTEDPLIDFYKARIKYFYNGHADQVDFENVEKEFRSRINKLIKTQWKTRENDVFGDHRPVSDGPMAVLGAGHFEAKIEDTNLFLVESAELNFINLPSLGRRLVPVLSKRLRGQFRAGYDAEIDATGIEVPLRKPGNFSLILILPGKSGDFKVGGLEALESKLSTDNWNSLLKKFVVFEDMDVRFPILRQGSLINLNETIASLGAKSAFATGADFTGINGGRDLKISSFYELSEFTLKSLEEEKRVINRNHSVNTKSYSVDFDRQFLYIVRHNPSGLIVFFGRYLKPPSKHAK